MSTSLRYRSAVASNRQLDDAVDAAEELRDKHARANFFFRRLFVGLAVALMAARLLLAFYGATSPFSLAHHAEAHMAFGERFWLLEVFGAASLALCGWHFVRPRLRLLASVGAANVVVFLWVVLRSEAGWLWERGWWFALYFGGFGLFFAAVSGYSDSLIRDDSVDTQLDALLAGTPGVQHV